MPERPRVMVTGAAGFIGFHVARRLLADGREVIGVDALDPYYDPALKQARLDRLAGADGWRFVEADLADASATSALFAEIGEVPVVHLAGQSGVRWSLDHPQAYVRANLVAFGHVLEGCRRAGVPHLVYASSSSVYGASTRVPYVETGVTDHPVSLYAATKKANEAMAHAYAHLFGVPCTGLRFFTVYGPWGRPDMAYWKFTEAILRGRPIEVFDHGRPERDFTYVDDVIEGVVRLIDRPAAPDPAWDGSAPSPATSAAPWRLQNVGNHTPVSVGRLIDLLEAICGRTAIRVDMPRPAGDLERTCADVEALRRAVAYAPSTPLETGLRRFVEWYRDWARV